MYYLRTLLLLAVATSVLVSQAVATELCYSFRTITVPNKASPAEGQTLFESINTSGRILGGHANLTPSGGFILQRQQTGPKVTITTLPAGAVRKTYPRKMNRYGEIVGLMEHTDTGALTGYIRKTDGRNKVIEVPGTAQSFVTGVNDKGDMVLQYLWDDGLFYAAVRSSVNGVATYAPLVVPGAVFTQPMSINNHKEVVGFAVGDDDVTHGWYWEAGLMVPMDAPGGLFTFLSDINDTGSIVGVTTDAVGTPHGVLYHEGLWYPIRPNVGEVYSEATGINSKREIAGNYLDGTGLHGFVATPVACPGAPEIVALAQ